MTYLGLLIYGLAVLVSAFMRPIEADDAPVHVRAWDWYMKPYRDLTASQRADLTTY